MDLTVNSVGIDGVLEELRNVTRNIPTQIRIAAREAAKFGKSQIAKEVSKQVRVTQKVVKNTIYTEKSGENGMIVALEKSNRIPLRDFKAMQNATGVRYNITQPTHAPGLFQIKSIGNRVFKRADQKVDPSGNPLPGTRMRRDPRRQQIVQCFGPSPWGVLRFNVAYQEAVGDAIATRFEDELRDRLRFLKLKQTGVI